LAISFEKKDSLLDLVTFGLWIGWGLLGTGVLILLHRLVAQFFPRPPASVYRSTFAAQRPPSEEEGDGMAAVYAMDTALMDAEFERPGSTFWIYYLNPGAVIARWIGSVILSFVIVTWILGFSKLSCGSSLLLLLGLALTVYPYQTWWMSRPRIKE
jgi:hypothetical protein